jgi:hypothetical protein
MLTGLKHRSIIIILLAANVFQGLLIRPSGDDFSALGRAAVSCQTWIDFAVRQWETSLGFRTLARATYCWDYSRIDFIYNLMVLSHILVSLILISSIFRLLLPDMKSKIHLYSISSLTNLLIFFPISKSELPIRQYLGPSWSSEWVQHTFGFELFILSSLLVLKWAQRRTSITYRLATIIVSTTAFTFSNLNFVYSIPILGLYGIQIIRARKENKFIKTFFPEILALCVTAFFVFQNATSLNRIGPAEAAQVEEAKLLRFLSIAVFSVRETFIAPLLFAGVMFFIGRSFFARKEKDLRETFFPLFFLILWTNGTLAVAETFSYYATWHHTPIQLLIFIASFELGRSFPGKHKFRKSVFALVIVLVTASQIIGSMQLIRYANTWDADSKDGLFQNASLYLPRSLGPRVDAYWENFQEQSQDLVRIPSLSSDVSRSEDLAVNVLRSPVIAFDSLLKMYLQDHASRDRFISWLI